MDLTAAFDTVDHSLLLTRLQKYFGVEGCCLEWFASYLSGRSYCMVVDGVSSKVIYIICLVRSCSVLGPCSPLRPVLYVADLADIVAESIGQPVRNFLNWSKWCNHCKDH